MDRATRYACEVRERGLGAFTWMWGPGPMLSPRVAKKDLPVRGPLRKPYSYQSPLTGNVLYSFSPIVFQAETRPKFDAATGRRLTPEESEAAPRSHDSTTSDPGKSTGYAWPQSRLNVSNEPAPPPDPKPSVTSRTASTPASPSMIPVPESPFDVTSVNFGPVGYRAQSIAPGTRTQSIAPGASRRGQVFGLAGHEERF